MSTEPIRLHGQQSASPATCGSCARFVRTASDPDPRYAQYAPTTGTCGINFPPWVKLAHTHAQIGSKENGFPVGVEYVENSNSWTRVKDTETCDFWKASGKTYVKDNTWTVEEQRTQPESDTKRFG